MKALFAAAALSMATCAMAGTVIVSNITHKDPTGFGTAFNDTNVYSFTLTENTWVSGFLNTKGRLGATPAIDIQAVTLTNAGTGQTFDWSELLAVDWNKQRTGLEQWELQPRDLSAGTWGLSVQGVSYSNKLANGYTVTLELPEPGTVALAAVAVLGALSATRRRKSA
ncbi:MAG: hypothetical protein V3V71_09290 [Roseateles sp.]|jgi:hypothetical protein|nr:hypothetical protein [Methylibium sp.]MBY0366901.1 hypothetical protein [Burkholderiaceae bacterium]|mmetsp:Transcript_12872/g.30276  ORF Transcript_12872/g.30276 Transcript_12872/m.30276 type:complete len:168 (+) Transcript_12872:3230-3733(+)